MDLIELPDHIYKYISFDNPYHRRIVFENEIFFSSVNKFNDPFDSTIPLRYDAGSDEQIFNLFIKLLHKDNPNLTDDELKRIARNELSYDNVRGAKRIQNTINNQRKIIASKFGIFSASHRYDSILMWSHYANLHKGICVGFNGHKLQNFIENDCAKEELIIVWDNVSYKSMYPVLNPFKLSDYELIMQPLLIKSEDWKYEEEIRFIVFDFPNKVVKLTQSIIDKIVLGCRTPTIHKEELKHYVVNKRIEIIQVTMKETGFGLDFN